MSNFDPNSVTNLFGLWDFRAGNELADTGLDDGVAQNGWMHGGANASGDQLHTDGNGDYFDVDGETIGSSDGDSPNAGDDDPFDMSKGTIEVQFTQDSQVGSSPDTVVNRGEYADRADDGFFSISVLADGSIKVVHCEGGEEAVLTTTPGTMSPGDLVNVKYSWDEANGVQLVVENTSSGAEQTVVDSTTGLTMDIGDNDDESFTFGARERDDGEYDKFFDGSIDYVAIYEAEGAGPDGAVDGEAFGEVMELGYDDANAPTDQGGDIITENADLIFGNGGDDTIDGEGGDDTIYGDSGTTGGPSREIFQWEDAPGFGNNNTAADFTQNTGSVNITFDIVNSTAGVDNEYETTDQNTDDLDAAVNENASFESGLDDDSDSATYAWEADQPVENVEFRINDIDGDGRVIVKAWDANGNPIEVTLSDAGSGLALSDSDGVPGNDTATSIDNNYTSDANAEHSVLVSIAGPVARWEVQHEQDGSHDSGINVTDIAFDAAGTFGEPGNDDITGGAGADDMFGEDGDDTFFVASAAEGDGDVIVGGNGPDDTTDNDVLDLRGAGRVTITQAADASDDGATEGTVTFDGGETLSFSQIETILTDPQNEDPDARDDTGTTDQGTPVVIAVLANDSDGDGDTLQIDSFTQPPNGTVTDNGDGTLTYTPDPAFVGTDTFEYTVSDGNGGFDTASVDVRVDDVAGPVDGLDSGEDMGPGYTDLQGDQIDGSDGDDDTIFGNGGDDTIDSGEGDDTVDGGGGDDVFDINDSGSGIDNDVLIGGETDETTGDVLDATGISDDLLLDITAPEEGTLTDGIDTTEFEEIEQFLLGDGDDTVDGSDGDDYVDGGGGDDSMDGGAGDDTLGGNVGDDTIDGGAGDDSLFGGSGDDSIIGGDGSDTVDGGRGNNVIDTSGGTPLLDLGFPAYGPFSALPADGDPDDDRDLVTTLFGDDSITTGDDSDTISSGSGDDTIDSGIDDDIVDAGAGDDLITTGEGNDNVLGGSGNDTIYGGLGPNAPDALNIPDAPGTGPFGPDPEPDNGKDTIDGGAGHDVIYGEDDDDLIMGGAGADTLDGGVDDDTILGGTGKDEITGGQGMDSMVGGDDRDTFHIDSREDAFGDMIDGSTGGNDVDTLDLTGLGSFEIVGETLDADGDSTSGTVHFLDAGGNIEGTLEFSEIERLIICFTPGARIATPRGEVEVQNLRAGDRVITRDDGVQDIHWIGHKKLKAADLIADPKLRPILIKQGSLGNGLPERDMMVSPNHRMLMANSQTHMLFDEREVLVAAKHLVGQPGIHQIDTLGTEYIHMMFERHEVILGDGAWTESFQPGDHSLSGIDADQRDEVFKLFPDLQHSEGRRAYGSARQSLKAHEARMLRMSMGGDQ